MGEWSGAHDIETRTEMGLDADVLGSGLARGVRAQRKERCVLVDREVLGRDSSIRIGGQYGDNPSNSGGVRRGEYVRGTLDVGAVRLDRVAPRPMYVALPREVIDDFGFVVEHVLLDGLRVGDVGAATGSVSGDH